VTDFSLMDDISQLVDPIAPPGLQSNRVCLLTDMIQYFTSGSPLFTPGPPSRSLFRPRLPFPRCVGSLTPDEVSNQSLLYRKSSTEDPPHLTSYVH